MKVCSFFSGIGGFDLAFEREGYKSIFLCEINGFCKKILRKHWPEVPLFDDITSLESNVIPVADVWCGGFPCQDVSVARGSKGREGLKGKNSGLFYAFYEHIKIRKPKILLLENVTGLLSSHNGQDFRIVLESLTSIGYAVSWRVMNSRYFGAPQSRQRIFICAVMKNPRAATSSLYEKARGAASSKKRDAFLSVSECSKTSAKVADIAYCLAATSGRHTGTDWSRTYISYEEAVRRMTPSECEGLQGFPSDWTFLPESEISDSDIDSPRYHALGNAVCVPVVQWIARQIKKSAAKYSKASSRISLKEIQDLFGDFSPDNGLRHMKLSTLHMSTKPNGEHLKWQAGGMAVGDDCWDIKAPEAPSKPIERKLVEILDEDYPDDKYFLSPNAAEGILRRVYSQNRTLFEPMHQALLHMVKKKKAA